ncbi:hypothetical protein LRP50_18695 [Enterovibrio sp. ZSDZ42]|uniref:Uncharacterized protein n=1 Tax=Enterovibrio gelatinilyticus TaxID=2899819 RepID=A0ABT5R5X5_9GAMM|nr:hypothetical protein [Enterovibrio sp. ZSDZ42]MDD1795161.1 hypothetical protein [Enterovibrio sp. ZSDZ42]
MKFLHVVRGDFSGEKFELKKNMLQSGFYNIKLIPIPEIVSFTKLDSESTEKTLYVEIMLFNGRGFVASMVPKTYKACYEAFERMGNNPSEVLVPIIRKSKSNIIYTAIGSIFILSILGGGQPKRELLLSEKAMLCKAYIGQLFSKPINIIDNYKNQDGLVYVRYIRPSDYTAWSYVCDVSSGNMLWAAWQVDTQEWGRWRFEDEVKLNYNKEGNKVNFKMVDTGKLVEVKL